MSMVQGTVTVNSVTPAVVAAWPSTSTLDAYYGLFTATANSAVLALLEAWISAYAPKTLGGNDSLPDPNVVPPKWKPASCSNGTCPASPAIWRKFYGGSPPIPAAPTTSSTPAEINAYATQSQMTNVPVPYPAADRAWAALPALTQWGWTALQAITQQLADWATQASITVALIGYIQTWAEVTTVDTSTIPAGSIETSDPKLPANDVPISGTGAGAPGCIT